jgi:hypothetical protein
MWSRLDDALIDHRKIFVAGARLGENGPAIALGFYAVCLMWSNKHLSDGLVPTPILQSFTHVEKPLVVADALTKAGLFDRVSGGIKIHDFGEYNKPAADIKRERQHDRERKRTNGATA